MSGGIRGLQVPWHSSKTGRESKADSGYELIRMWQYDHDPDVVTWKKNAERVPYGDGRSYVPDFLVERRDGTKTVEEVKPANFLSDPVVQQKAAAARKFFAKQGIDYRFITEYHLREHLALFDLTHRSGISAALRQKLDTLTRTLMRGFVKSQEASWQPSM